MSKNRDLISRFKVYKINEVKGWNHAHYKISYEKISLYKYSIKELK